MKFKAAHISKIVLIFVTAIVLFSVMQINVKAESLKSLVPDNNEISVMDKVYIKQRSSHIDFGMIKLSKVSATRAGILGSTQAFHECPEVHLGIYVDQYDEDSGEWHQWRYWEYSAENVDHLTKDMEIIVQSGHYYSVRGYHTCVHGDVIETIETRTDGLYIGLTNKPNKPVT